jgi:hypothetical protein
MTASWPHIRLTLFRIGLSVLLLDIALYFVGCGHVQWMIKANLPLENSLRAGARYFVVGSALAILSIPFLLLGRGWKRLPLVAISIILIPLFIGFTLY